MNRRPLTDEDGEVRDITTDEFERMRPIAEVDPGMVEAVHRMKKGGRPRAETPKVHVGLRMAVDVVDGIKATGRGYNARAESVLREALAAGRLDADRRPKSEQAESDR